MVLKYFIIWSILLFSLGITVKSLNLLHANLNKINQQIKTEQNLYICGRILAAEKNIEEAFLYLSKNISNLAFIQQTKQDLTNKLNSKKSIACQTTRKSHLEIKLHKQSPKLFPTHYPNWIVKLRRKST